MSLLVLVLQAALGTPLTVATVRLVISLLGVAVAGVAILLPPGVPAVVATEVPRQSGLLVKEIMGGLVPPLVQVAVAVKEG